MPAEKTGTAEPVEKRVRRQLRGCGVEEARASATSPTCRRPRPWFCRQNMGGQNHGVVLPLRSF
jgi:hypothetical protein